MVERKHDRWRKLNTEMVSFAEMNHAILGLASAYKAIPDLDDRTRQEWDEDEVA